MRFSDNPCARGHLALRISRALDAPFEPEFGSLEYSTLGSWSIRSATWLVSQILATTFLNLALSAAMIGPLAFRLFPLSALIGTRVRLATLLELRLGTAANEQIGGRSTKRALLVELGGKPNMYRAVDMASGRCLLVESIGFDIDIRRESHAVAKRATFAPLVSRVWLVRISEHFLTSQSAWSSSASQSSFALPSLIITTHATTPVFYSSVEPDLEWTGTVVSKNAELAFASLDLSERFANSSAVFCFRFSTIG